ncbi:hypothetical protein QJQ45_015406 [Haematococcus lacustris]|nr:hypothetical protein QJQ45_015406 [Haematococcus lacustris]
MAEIIKACDNLVPAVTPLAHRTCAEAAAAALAVGKRLQGQEQPMPSLCSTPTQAAAQPGPAHSPCPHHLPDQPPSHPSQLQGSSQHHPALPALLHLPGLSILTRPATNPVTSPAVEQQPIIHTTKEQDEQTMPPSMPKQQQDWATASILVACAYFKNKEGAYYEQTVYVMTDGKEQSAAITQAAVNQVKRDDKHWDDECLTLLCSFAPDSVMQLCTLGKKLSVKMLNEYCKAVGLCMGLYSKSHPYRRKGCHAARCACCATCTQASSTGWVEIHVEGEAASYRSRQSLLAIGQVTAQMAEIIKACDNLVPAVTPLAHRTCAEAAAAALAVGKRLQGQEQPMPSLCSTPTQAAAQPGPAHSPCPHHLPDQPPSHPSQLQGSSQHHPALPALLHLPGLSILTRPATNPVTSPAVEQQPIIHTTKEQDEQTMPPSMPKQQQDWATARCTFHSLALTCTSPALHQPCPAAFSWRFQVEWSQTACACAQCMTPAPRGLCMRPSITKPFVAMPMFDQKRDDKHWDDECLTLLCSFAPDSVMQLCTLGKKLSVKMLNEYCKAVGLCVPANTLRADLRYMVLQHLNEQAECD